MSESDVPRPPPPLPRPPPLPASTPPPIPPRRRAVEEDPARRGDRRSRGAWSPRATTEEGRLRARKKRWLVAGLVAFLVAATAVSVWSHLEARREARDRAVGFAELVDGSFPSVRLVAEGRWLHVTHRDETRELPIVGADAVRREAADEIALWLSERVPMPLVRFDVGERPSPQGTRGVEELHAALRRAGITVVFR